LLHQGHDSRHVWAAYAASRGSKRT
jgi:hypothetical protein